MKSVSFLPKFLRWLFTFFLVCAALAAIAVCVVMLVNPTLPPTAHFGPVAVNMLGQPGTVVLRSDQGNSVFTLAAVRGSIILSVWKAGGVIEVIKQYGLPALLIYTLFLAALFELLRRLFRNVGRGDSFTWQSVRLVQSIGGLLIVYSVVSKFAERRFAQAMFSYLSDHSVVTISGLAVHLPPHHMSMFSGHIFPFGSPVFWSGLLVLALSEVFRQGLVIKSENDLTV
jgi:Protein of unknown function (DUF2975)